MRKFLVFQWILLVVGISVLIFCEFDCELPQGLLDKLKLRLQINVQKIQIKSRCITFSDFNYKNFSCKRLKIRWKSLFGEFQYFIEDGHLSYQGEHFYDIKGRLYGQFGKIRGFLELKNDTIKTMQFFSTDFVKISDLTREFQDEDGEFYTENKYKSKVNLKEGTILTYSMLYEKEKMQDSLRYVEYNMITMPTTLDIGNYIDIRLRLPNAQDLIVITKKEIVNIYDTTVGLYLTEEEIVLLNSAIVEAYIMTSSELYMATYVEPGMQGQAIYTYSPTAEVVALIQSNQNIVFEAREAIVNRYNGSGAVRNPINNSLGQYAEEAKGNVEQGMQEQIEAARKAREDYLSELNGY